MQATLGGTDDAAFKQPFTHLGLTGTWDAEEEKF
jgi:hypothetical protein